MRVCSTSNTVKAGGRAIAEAAKGRAKLTKARRCPLKWGAVPKAPHSSWRRSVVGVILAVGQVRLSVSVIYLVALVVAGLRQPPDLSSTPDSSSITPTCRVLAFVPAHDEELSVASSVQSLIHQDYPHDLYEVIVVADNCGDATADLARSAGATVWERTDAGSLGKGAALRWALARAEHERPDTDAVVFVDADCQASINLISALMRALRQKASAAQARYLVSNAADSSHAALRSAGFSLKHVIRARGRAGLGLSPGLFGTGMAFAGALTHHSMWSESVTEDTELFLRLIEGGHSIAYVEEAYVDSPAPVTTRDAESQQVRWETGNQELARGRLLRLTYRGLLQRDRELIGAAAELALPPQSALVASQTGLCVVALLTGRRALLWVSLATLAGEVAYVIGGLALIGEARNLMHALRALPYFLAARVRVLATVSTGGRAHSWERTSRPT